MLIRCQKCKALFSLQDSVAGAAGSFEVQCGRCGDVFTAQPPERIKTPAPQQHPVTPAPRAPDSGSLERKAEADALARALRPRRPGEEVPATPIRRNRWLLGLGLAIVLLAAFVARSHFSTARASRARMEQGRLALLRDDAKSLEEATALFTEAARLSPGDPAPEAQRAFALLLQAATHKDLVARLDAPIKDLVDRAATAAEPEKQKLAEQAAQLSLARERHARNLTRRLQEGLAAAKAALEDDKENPVALRSLALHAALDGAPEKGAAPLDAAARNAPSDPWVAWTRAALALAAPPSRGAQDRALAALAVARQGDPHLLRAQVDAAEISIDRQEAGPARALLLQVLDENPHHERAQQLLSLLPPAP